MRHARPPRVQMLDGSGQAVVLPRTGRVPSRLDLQVEPGELMVLACVAGGKTNAEVATHLFITVRTVKKHLERIFDKLGVRTRAAAVAVAYDAACALQVL